MESTLSDLDLLADSATRFLSREFNGDIYTFIGDRLYELSGDSLVVVNEYNPTQNSTIVRAMCGCAEWRDEIVSLLVRHPVELELGLHENPRSKLTPGKLIKVEGGLFELAFGHFPQELCQEIETRLGIGAIFAIPFATRNDFLGTVAILTRAPQLPPRTRVIEAFIGLAGMALQQNRVESERTHLLKQLENERTLWKTTVESMPDPVTVCDSQGIATYMNPVYSHLAKLLIDPTINLEEHPAYYQIYHTDGTPFNAEDLPLQRSALYDETVNEVELVHHLTGGDERIVMFNAAPLHDTEGHLLGAVAVGRDITRQRQVEAEHQQLIEQLEMRIQERTKDLEKALADEQAMRRQLIQAEKHSAISRMVASVAHEINNPLQTIENCLYLSQQEVHEDQALEYLEMASSETRRISNLVAQLREIYRPVVTEKVQRLSLGQLVDEVHALLMPHLQYQQVVWTLNGSSEGLAINAVSDQIKQVFLNISLNAIEAMQPAGGSLTVTFLRSKHPGTHELVIGVKKVASVGIAFKDSGPGIPEESLNKVFEPFFTTKESGTGLGLPICYDIVKRLNGQIKIESRVGQGATFTVWLPLAT